HVPERNTSRNDFLAQGGIFRERERIRSWKLRLLSGENPGTGADPELEAPATFWGESGNGVRAEARF
ncbi:MAG: hypothetical protein WCT05_07390, partial [Lentisphaeria bacterium]